MRRALLLLALLAPLAGRASSAGPSHPPPRPVDPGGHASIIRQLAVLRRPARPGDTSPALRATLAQWAHLPGCLATIAAPGLTRSVRPGLYLVVLRPPRCVFHCTGTERACARPRPMAETATLVPAPRLEPLGYWTSANLAAGQAFGDVGKNRTALLVPDGVAKVGLGGVVEPVGQNVVLLPLSASGRVRWLNGAGQVIRSYTL